MVRTQKVQDGPKVLVAVASKHGATQEIAEKIWRILGESGISVDFKKIDASTDIRDYDAFILGSAVYVGSWLEAAKDFVEKNSEDLSKKPVWLFSSGPIGEPAKPAGDKSVNISDILMATKAKEHRIFNGKIDKNRLSFGEKAIILAVGAKEGDFRDWPEITAWAKSLVKAIKTEDF